MKEVMDHCAHDAARGSTAFCPGPVSARDSDSVRSERSAILVQSSSRLPRGADAAPVAPRIEPLTTDQKGGASYTSGRALVCGQNPQVRDDESPPLVPDQARTDILRRAGWRGCRSCP